MTTTVGRYLKLPSGASERLGTDAPLSSSDLAILSSNATVLCREGSLRPLWECAGDEVWTDCTTTDDPTTFPWDTSGVFTRFAGRHRVRQYGDTSSWPLLRVRARGRAPSTFTLGVVVVVQPSAAYPDVAAPRYCVARTTSTTVASFDATLALDSTMIAAEDFTATNEAGRFADFVAWVGAYCTSNSSGTKGLLSDVVLYLDTP